MTEKKHKLLLQLLNSSDTPSNDGEASESPPALAGEDEGGEPPGQPEAETEREPSAQSVAQWALRRKLCRVCGDSARGINFGVFSCESCKAFFRRRATSSKRLRCPFEPPGRCSVTAESRRRCLACRYDKCLRMGMRLLSAAPGPVSASTFHHSLFSAETAVQGPKDGTVRLRGSRAEPKEKRICACSCSCGYYPKEVPLGPPGSAGEAGKKAAAEAERDWEDVAAMIAEDREAWTRQSSPYSPHHDTAVPESSGKMLGLDDLSRLAGLLTTGEHLHAELEGPSHSDQPLSLTEAANATAETIRRILRMFADLPEFASLTETDQRVLMKSSMMELLVLHGMFTYNAETDGIRHGPREVPASSFLPINHGEAYQQLVMYLWSFEREWRANETVLLLLLCLVVFEPERAGLAGPDAVLRCRQEFLGLLRRYLAVTYEGSRGEWALEALLNRLTFLPGLRDACTKIFRYTPKEDLEPLLLEFFALEIST